MAHTIMNCTIMKWCDCSAPHTLCLSFQLYQAYCNYIKPLPLHQTHQTARLMLEMNGSVVGFNILLMSALLSLSLFYCLSLSLCLGVCGSLSLSLSLSLYFGGSFPRYVGHGTSQHLQPGNTPWPLMLAAMAILSLPR